MVSSPHSSGPPAPDFDSWVAARAPALSRFAFVLTGGPEPADDVVQEALASAYSRWHQLATADVLESRLQAEAVRAHLRRGRARHGRHGEPADAADARGVSPWLPTPGGAMGPSPEATEVWERCAGLSARQRAALVLRCYAGLAGPEIAEAMGCRARTASAALDQALERVAPSARHSAAVTAVGGSLREYAELAPHAHATAERAIQRARRHRRRRTAIGGAAAVALTAPVLWAFVAGAGDPDDVPPAGAPLGSAPVDYSGWRWESWGGIQVRVPGSWGHGDLTQWCAPRGPDGPAVDRPEMQSTQVLCSLSDDGRPTYTGGLLLRRAAESPRLSRADVAPYATTRIHTVGDVTLTVIDIDRSVGSAILASAQVIGRRDHNGCEPHRLSGRSGMTVFPEDLPGIARVDSVESVSVCRYGLEGWPGPTLISSRRLDGGSAARTLAALKAAPVRPLDDAPDRCRGAIEEYAVLELWRPADEEPTSVIVTYDGCRMHGIDDGTARRGLTAAVLDPILVPPWTGELSADVPRRDTKQPREDAAQAGPARHAGHLPPAGSGRLVRN